MPKQRIPMPICRLRDKIYCESTHFQTTFADPPPHTHAVGGQPCCPQPKATACVLWSWRLKGCIASASAVRGIDRAVESYRCPTAMPCWRVLAIHFPGDIAVRMRKVLQTAGLVFECVPCYFRLSHFSNSFPFSNPEKAQKLVTWQNTPRFLEYFGILVHGFLRSDRPDRHFESRKRRLIVYI